MGNDFKNLSPTGPSPLKISLQFLLLPVITGGLGLISFFVLLFFRYLVGSICSSFWNSNGYLFLYTCGFSYQIGFISTLILISFLIYKILKWSKIKDARLLTLFSTPIAYLLISDLSSGEIFRNIWEGMFTSSAIFIFLFLLFFLLLNLPKLSRKKVLIISFTLAIALLVPVYIFGNTAAAKLASYRFHRETDTKLRSSNLDLYAPVNYTDLYFQGYESSHFTDPLYITIFFNSIKANIFNKPEYFNPPSDCGLNIPGYKDQNHTSNPCSLYATTPKGRNIYEYHQKVSATKEPEMFFIPINLSVIVFDSFPKDLQKGNLITIADSFEKVSVDELENLKKQGKEVKKTDFSNAEKNLGFKIFKPSYTPLGYIAETPRLKLYNRDNPDFVNVLLKNEQEFIVINQFVAKKDIAVLPTNKENWDCGGIDPEWEDIGVGDFCKPWKINNQGIQIYSDIDDFYLSIGPTRVTVSMGLGRRPKGLTDDEILKIINSLEETSLSKIKYERK